MHTRIVQWMGLLACCLLSAGCKTPYAQPLSIDWNGEPGPGTITVSQPKMYQRASLINERNEKTKWLNKLLEDSKTAKFTPQISRELEQVTTFALALGLNVDPAKAVTNRRYRETGDLQQQIDVVTLQAQLTKLKLAVAAADAAAPEPAPKKAGADKAASKEDAPTETAPTAARQLKTAIDELTKTLVAQVAAEVKQAGKTAIEADPIDVFHDTSVYRGLIETGLNATGMDDLHDLGGRALVRLNFQAMVLPDREHARVPGVIQMKIQRPETAVREQESIYKGWLEHINQQLNATTASDKDSNNAFLMSAAADNFDLVAYRYRPSTLAAARSPAEKLAGKSRGGQHAATLPRGDCRGIVLDLAAASPVVEGDCETLRFVVPKFAGTSAQEGAYSTLQSYKDSFHLEASEEEDRKDDVAARLLISSHAKSIVQNCGLPVKPHVPISPEVKLYDYVRRAQISVAAGEVFIGIERVASRIMLTRGLAVPPPDEEQQKIAIRSARARQFLLTFIMVAYDGCKPEEIKRFHDRSPIRYVPPSFLAVLDMEQPVMVYEIGPREQAQQVSSVSRIANNLSLAGALAASAPRTGAGLDAAANFSRQAVGKASTIERLPAVIGYAANKGIFGWVLGPAAVFDPQGAVRLEQVPRVLDLTVDLSLPGWWPSFNVEISTVWAPSRAAIIAGSIKLPNQVPTIMEVKTSPNYADYDALSARLMLGGRLEDRQVFFSDRTLDGQSLTACRESTLYISGNNIWRATSALVGDQLLDATTITVAPDMSGILLKIPQLDQQMNANKNRTLPVSVFTRYGAAEGTVTYLAASAGVSCAAPGKVSVAAKPN